VSIGPLVACTSFHNPALLAKQAATVDEIASGRFVLGLGAGWNETEFRAFGFPFDQRIARFEEAFTIIRTLLQEGQVDFDGRFHQARDCELLPRPRPGGPPLLIGSNGPRMLRIAAPHVQAWNTWSADTDNTPEGVAPLRALVDAACRDVGRDPAAIARTVAVHVRMVGGQGRTMGNTTTTQRVVPLEGSPEVIADGLRAYAAVGVSEVQVVLDPIDRPSIVRFAAILPLLDRG
jgi:alkanesulfonate monooxygenase SsuD/methylene tetrahydromethanopterin reductase-like flavin-dependent oxidoreductase (luciferase family)